MTAFPDNATRPAPPKGTRRSPRRALAIVAATGAALVLWLTAVPLAGVELEVELSGAVRSVDPAMITITGLAVGLGAWALLAAIERVRAGSSRAWTILATLTLALSLVGPIGSAVNNASMLTLVAMHLIVGTALIVGLRSPSGTAPNSTVD